MLAAQEGKSDIRHFSMVHHHLPQFVAHLASAGRHALTYCDVASRAFLGTLYRLESPRDAFRVALRQTHFLRRREPLGKGQMAGRTIPLLIHYHIFKNAGSSFEWALQQTFGDRFRQYDSASPGGLVSSRELARLVRREPHLAAVSSHQAAPPAPRILGRKVITSILIRDPIARIGSIYAFERAQQAGTPGAIMAKELDFRSYVEWRLETCPAAICNYQVHVCAGKKDIFVDCRQSDLEAAIIRLDAIDIVGTVRRYGEWLALAQAVLGEYDEALSFEPSHRNRSVSKPVESEAEILAGLIQGLGLTLTEELLCRNELDMRLHQVADALLTRRLAERGVKVTLRLAYSQAQGNRPSEPSPNEK